MAHSAGPSWPEWTSNLAHASPTAPDSLGYDDSTIEYAVGVVHYRSYDELDRCLAAIADQKLRPAMVFVVDGEADPEQLAAVRERHPDVEFEAAPNRGLGPILTSATSPSTIGLPSCVSTTVLAMSSICWTRPSPRIRIS